MRKFLIPAVSLAALTVGGIAFADTAAVTTPTTKPATTQAQPGNDQSTTTVMPKKVDENTAATQTTTQPRTDQSATTTVPKKADQNAATQTTTQPAPATTGVAMSGVDFSNAFLASNLIGSSGYSPSNENVGDVNDIVFSKDGKVQAIIIGVGGFLGLGEKDVAVPMEKLQFARDENNRWKFTINASRDELEKAAAFDKTKIVIGSGSTTVQ
jgi:sporulation protein YlmC with PRC-barrel domain